MTRLYTFLYGIINNIFFSLAVDFVYVLAYGECVAQRNAHIYKDKRKIKTERRAPLVPIKAECGQTFGCNSVAQHSCQHSRCSNGGSSGCKGVWF